MATTKAVQLTSSKKRRVKKQLPVWDINVSIVKNEKEAQELLERWARKMDAYYRREAQKAPRVYRNFEFTF